MRCFGGYFVCVYVLELSAEDYISGIHTYVEMSDIVGGLTKSAVLVLFFLGLDLTKDIQPPVAHGVLGNQQLRV